MEGSLACCVRVSVIPRKLSSLPKSGSTYLATANTTRVANTQGGAQSRRVTVRLYPSVAARVGKNVVNEKEVKIQAVLHVIGELKIPRSMKNDVLQCHVCNPPIRKSIQENSSSTLDFGLTFIADTDVFLHSLLGQSGLNRGQPTMGSGREVRKDEYSDEGNKYCQSALNEE